MKGMNEKGFFSLVDNTLNAFIKVGSLKTIQCIFTFLR